MISLHRLHIHFKALTGRVARDTLLFFVGLGGIVYETLTNGAEKPTLIIAFVGMLGLPLFIRNDEAHKSQEPDTTKQMIDITLATPSSKLGRHHRPDEE